MRSNQDYEDEGEGRIASIGHSAVIAGYARVVTIVASIIGPILLGIGSWTAGQAYSAFQTQRDKLEEVRLTIGVVVAERKADAASISATGARVDLHDARLLDHERRISRVEAVVPISPLIGPR